LSQGRAIWEIIQEAYVIPATLENATQGALQRYENNYKVLNLITTALARTVYDHVSHLETAHDVWLKLCNTYEGSSEIKSSRKDIYNRQYQIFSQKPGESLDDCSARFESIVSNLRACGPFSYTDNEGSKQLLYALDDHVWGMKITALEEYADFAKDGVKHKKTHSNSVASKKNEITLKGGCLLSTKSEVNELLASNSISYALVCKDALISLHDMQQLLPPIVANILQEYADVFPCEVPAGLPPLRGIEHQINLILGASLPNHAPYRTNPEETKKN
jgi:hypothetical protein